MNQLIGAAQYREGALYRLEDAKVMLGEGRWVSAAYLSGRAVESMMRALIWLKTQKDSQGVGHDLRDLLRQARSLNMLTDKDHGQMIDAINFIAVVWQNNLRYIGPVGFRAYLKAKSRDRGVRGDFVKYNVRRLVEDCERVIARGEIVWKRSCTNFSD